MNRKIKMPKTKAGLEEMLMNAFLAGCTHGYGVEHTVSVQEQEQIGAECYIGKISIEEMYKQWEELKGGGIDG